MALQHAVDGGAMRWAGRAARALNREPVLAGSVFRFAILEDAITAATCLARQVAHDQRHGLLKFLHAAVRLHDSCELDYEADWRSS